MPHTTLQAVIGFACLAQTCMAAPMREVPVRGIGYIGPGSLAEPPESATCGKPAYTGSAAFPFLNRSIVIDLGRPALVHRLVMLDDYKDSGGTSPSICAHGIRVFTSRDGLSFRPYSKRFRTTIRSGTREGVFDVVELDGLAIMVRYIKLHADLPTKEWDFANKRLTEMVRAYQDPGLAAAISYVRVDRYSAGRAQVYARIDMPSGDRSPLALQVSLPMGRALAQFAVPASGVVRGAIDVDALPAGPHDLRFELVSQQWGPLAFASAKTYVCAEWMRNPDRSLAGKAGRAIVLDGLECLWPRSTFPIEGADDCRIWTGQPGAPALRVALPVRGWHAVSIGLIGDSQAQATLGSNVPRRVKLQVWRQHDKAVGLGEAFVGCADLGDTVLEVRPLAKQPCRLAFVRLVGMSPEQIKTAEAARALNTAGRVTVNNDGYSMFFSGMDSKERLHGMIDRYRGRRLYSYDYCLGSDATCTYPTKVGTVFGTNVETFWRQGDRRAYEGIQKMIRAGDDPLRVAIDRCRANGTRVHLSFRANANYGPPNAKTMNSRQYWAHYDCRIMMHYKKRRVQLSYAYPQVRAYRLAVIKEGLGYGPDGLHLDFLRHPPFVGHDKPLTDAFKEKYGADPFENPEDARWLSMQAEVMTGFVRDVRQLVNEASREHGRKMVLTASFDRRGYRLQALDVARWAKEGLVDQISPGVHGLGGKRFSVAELAKMVEGTNCQLFARLEHTIQGHDPTPASERGEVVFHREHMTLNLYRRRALELYDEGAQGFYLFNSSGLGYINTLSDVAGLRAWDAFERPLVGWFEAGS